MSNNLLGKDENLNAVQPDFVTGGESLSELLKNPHCPLRTLNVSAHGFVDFCNAVKVVCNSEFGFGCMCCFFNWISRFVTMYDFIIFIPCLSPIFGCPYDIFLFTLCS